MERFLLSRNRPDVDPASFRDPSGRVYIRGERIFRTVMPCAATDFSYVETTGLINELEMEGLVLESTRVDPLTLGEQGAGAAFVIEHPRLPFISYPYEWSFPALKAASLITLDIQLRAIEKGVTLSDASAYNVQFIGPKPIFIDRLSFQKYEEGDFWQGHKQFCEQFLNPLLLRSLFGVPHNSWYRGSQEGIPSEDLVRLLNWRQKMSRGILTNLVLPVAFQRKVSKGIRSDELTHSAKQKLPLVTLRKLLNNLKKWVEELKPADTGKSIWSDYTKTQSYSSTEAEKKHKFISKFIESIKPGVVCDLGSNTGDCAATAIKAGAEYVVGFDNDQKALEIAFSRAQEENLAYLPLFLDAANPSPEQGWAQKERKGLSGRLNLDAIVALAFTHHLIIGRNIPLRELLQWLTGLAPNGILEFVPKSDPMVQRMLHFRKDIFENYTDEEFLSALKSFVNIVETEIVSSSGRRLIRYSRP